MKSFEIYFDDLNEETQKLFLKFLGLEGPAEGNLELGPIAIIGLKTMSSQHLN